MSGADSLRAAAFLDRDGVINIDHGYLYRWQDFEFVPGAVEAMRQLQALGYLLVVVTNQSGVARGMYTEADVRTLHDQMRASLSRQGVELADVQYCPHHEQGQVAAYVQACGCRKPRPGMLNAAARALGLDLARSLIFGDKASDVQAGAAAGLRWGALLATDAQGEPDQAPEGLPTEFRLTRALSLLEAVKAAPAADPRSTA